MRKRAWGESWVRVYHKKERWGEFTMRRRAIGVRVTKRKRAMG